MKIFINHSGIIKVQRLEYVLNFIEDHPLNDRRVNFVLCEPESFFLRLDYGTEQDEGTRMPAQRYLFAENDIQPELLHINTFIFEEKVLYSIETVASSLSRPLVEEGKFQFDLFETIFFHISRLEEIFSKSSVKDSIGLVPEENFLTVKMNIHHTPVVDELVSAFLKVLGLDSIKRQTAYILTHDIDKIYKYNCLCDGIKAIGWPLIFRRSVKESWLNVYHFLKVVFSIQEDPYDTYQWLLREEKFWESRIVYFMAGGKTNYDLFDKYYKKYVKGIMDLAKDRGYEIGIHPSFEAGRDEALFVKEIDFLRSKARHKILHSRQHWLRFFHIETPLILENNKIESDSSFGYRRHIGFRSGTGFFHRLYNFREERSYNFYLLPLVVMDSALLHASRDNVDAFELRLKKFILQNRLNTCITFNFHNSTFDYTLGERSRLRTIFTGMVDLLDDLTREQQV